MTGRADLDAMLATEMRRRRTFERTYVRRRDAVSTDLVIRLGETALAVYDRFTPQGRADANRREIEALLDWDPWSLTID
jgi:hypothetical protein